MTPPLDCNKLAVAPLLQPNVGDGDWVAPVDVARHCAPMCAVVRRHHRSASAIACAVMSARRAVSIQLDVQAGLHRICVHSVC